MRRPPPQWRDVALTRPSTYPSCRATSYAVVNGFVQGAVGASALTVFNPRATDPAGRVMVFSDPALGVEVLQRLRAPVQPRKTAPAAVAKTKGAKAKRAA